ncbi:MULTISPECIES: glycosyltransferase family 9 protein [unclassified Beijerinckia]|uniref:glycosyltransferase family 9 protein n=1 Tax=unclassified Beijerinckia TaxID=2638183 RepID=UPI00089D14B1|nr:MULTISPECIES: glycosyltransferase family 9 protein [unclassified Beijerinckia]MDH7797008.1 ADP-heptose:LPS heptosyltransferase/tetratricopeptide (TPR) repeat protein [Beijerinckia sp. GAS462]SEC68460.1 ADP-heptose:LPS heptosyltransferase [Beijerinckia sp. 28-YEA-48]
MLLSQESSGKVLDQMKRYRSISAKFTLLSLRRQRSVDTAAQRDPGDNVAALVARADELRDKRDFEAAAEAYQIALRADPKNLGLFVQLGNCLKDANKHAAALRAYSELIAIEDNGDVELQLGHLLKITGNFRSALQAYRRSRALGDERSVPEIADAPHWRSEVVIVGEPLPALDGGGDAPLSAFHAIFACNLDETPDRSRFQHAGSYLVKHGMSELGRAFCEFASLGVGGVANYQAHAEFVLESGVWPYSDVSELTSGQFTRMSSQRVGDRAQLRKIVLACLVSDKHETLDRELATPHLSGEARWPPKGMEATQLKLLSKQLPVSIRSLYEAIWFTRAGRGQAVIEAVGSLAEVTQGMAGCIFMPSDRSYKQLFLCATFILAGAVSRWLVASASRFTSPLVNPALLEELLSVGNNPIIERIERGRSYAAVFYEIEEAIYGAAEKLTFDQVDMAMARLFALCLPEFRPQDIDGFLDVAAGQATRTAVLLVEASGIDKSRTEADLLSLAQKLKSLGAFHLALQVMERIDEEIATTHALVEKALISKVLGNFPQAVRLLERCVRLDPQNEFLRRELVMVLPEVESLPSILARYRTDEIFMASARIRACFRIALQEEREVQMDASVSDDLRVSDLSPELAIEMRHHSKRRTADREEILILAAGSGWRRGVGLSYRVLRRVDFVRAQSATSVEVVRLRVRIDGKTVADTAGLELSHGFESSSLKHKIYNCWLDLSEVPTGLHEMQLYFEEHEAGWRAVQELVWVDTSELASHDSESSLALVSLTGADSAASVSERIAKMPSVVLRAARTLASDPIGRILIVRADQLGDTSQSIPAILKMRDAFPEASFECLTSPGNVELLDSIGVFDHVHTVELTYDIFEKRRYASLNEQLRLRRLFEPKQFDLAIDLSPGFETQNLLRLTCARHTAGFKPREFPWMTFGADVCTHDPINSKEKMPHSAMILSFVAALVATLRYKPTIVERRDLDWSLLAPLGVHANERFAVFHTGARLEVQRWPILNFVALTRLVISRLEMKVVLLTDHESVLHDIDLADVDPSMVVRNVGKMTFKTFDTLLSLCSVFVGNDSGPKHLAALRGTPVVSVHAGRVNWNEWGQDSTGYVVARRVPCVGCGVELAEQCGRAMPCLIDIKPEEVFAVVSNIVTQGASNNRLLSESELGVGADQ